MATSTTQLLIFSKYPTAGKAKTRLIPALGATGAAQLHRRLAEITVETARVWQHKEEDSQRRVTLHYTGAPEIDFINWFGKDFTYAEQSGRNLGERMENAFATTFAGGAHYAIGIGTDVPALSPPLLQQAEQSLADHDLVLGPAADGGYYLIGLKNHHPELFRGIDWGTDKVLKQTLEIATQLRLNVILLDELSDIDRPDDLNQLKNNPRFEDILDNGPAISVIIPTLNEATVLEKTLLNLKMAENVEIIVADAGSTDETSAIATRSGAELLEVSDGRASQLNRGAKISRGKHLLFLHADTILPTNYPELIVSTLKDPSVAAGAFRFKTTQPGIAMRIVEWGTNLRSTRLQTPYGDQGLFLRREVFEELGGFPPLPIMEDFAFVRQLRQRGTIITLAAEAITSARRWQKLGVIRTTVINQLMIIGFLLRVSPEKLSHFYRRGKDA